ncbi:MAG: hypothetical protein V1849_04180 [Chloroflexota bacterium]
MKTLVKRLYCPYCQKLVAGREERSKDNWRILCSKCSRPIRTWNRHAWSGLKISL